jgi:hypothetical protein
MSKESGFRVRVEESLRKAFIEACRKKDQTASQEIRKFMRDYVEESGNYLQTGLFPSDSVQYQQPGIKKQK